MKKRLARLPGKMKGKLKGTHAPLSIKYAIWGMLSGTVSILAILAVTKMAGYPLLIGSFGASAVLLFGANESPLAQPRNLIGGHLVSASGGSGCRGIWRFRSVFNRTCGRVFNLPHVYNTYDSSSGRCNCFDRRPGACRLCLSTASSARRGTDSSGGRSFHQ